MNPKNVALIVNPISGDIDKFDLIEIVRNYVLHKNCLFDIYYMKGFEDDFPIQNFVNIFQPKLILIAGGDGTVKIVSEALQNYLVDFAIIPAGSANGLAVDLDLKDQIIDNLEIAFSNHFIDLDRVIINNKISLHLSDIGLNAQLIKNFQNSNTRGMLGYAIQAISTLVSLEDPFMVSIATNKNIFSGLARMVVIANSKKYGTGVVINPNGLINDGMFEIVVLRNLDIFILGKIISGNIPIESDDVEIFSATDAVISTNVPVNFQMDGEYIGELNQLHIKIHPNPMRVAIPKVI